MSNIQYHIIRGNGIDNVVALDETSDTPIYQADSNHPHWWAILSGLQKGDREVFQLFDVKGGVQKRLRNLSDKVTFDGDTIFYNGQAVTGPLVDHLLRVLREGTQDYQPILKFWEKVNQNPSMRSREQLFTWLKSHEFTITEDGDILGYKGVARDRDGNFTSISQGEAEVNGVTKKGAIPNPLGAVVTMDRSKVMDDPNVACHHGLHVGDWSYAKNFGRGAVLEVHVNPRDVVSIPKDSNQRKMRTCRYKVIAVRDAKSNRAIEFKDAPVWQGSPGYAV